LPQVSSKMASVPQSVFVGSLRNATPSAFMGLMQQPNLWYAREDVLDESKRQLEVCWIGGLAR
jgi:hypothetical protein